MYGMTKTTVYLPDDLKATLARTARTTGQSEAELIRQGVQAVVDSYRSPRPRIPLFSSGQPTLAESIDDALEGFGEA